MKLFEITNGFDEAKFEKDCAFYLKQMGDKAKSLRLYRGSDTTTIIRPFRPRTESVSMPKHFHEIANKVFKEKYGQPFRNGLFTTGRQDSAESYGDLKVIIPIGKFEWLCNPDIHDLYGLYIKLDNGDGPVEKLFTEAVSSSDWVNNRDLPECIESKREIMLWCPGGYYNFNPDNFLPSAVK